MFSFSGVALGILSICVIITTIDGANRRANAIFEALGPDSIMVFGGSESQRSARERFNTLTLQDAESVSRIGGIYELSKGLGARDVTLRYRDRKWNTLVIGTTANYFSSFSWKLYAGTVFSDEDLKESSTVCVLGWKVYDELFRGGDAVGKTIQVGKLPVKVLGVLEEKGGSFGSTHIDDRTIMPLTTVMGRVTNERRFISFIRMKTSRDITETVNDIKSVLRKNHGILEGIEDDFTIRDSKDILRFLSVISGPLVLFLGTASVIALLVSGFVLANLFYLSIQERKKDIGIRRAYGATRRGIIFSFLLESVVITTLGGIAGIILSLLLAGTFEKFFDLPMIFSYKVIVFALFFSLMTGILSGLRPALRASRIEPIEAIRG